MAENHIERATQLSKNAISSADLRITNEIALELFRLQAEHVPVYSGFLESMRIDPASVKSVDHIPHLPIAFFKTHDVLMTDAKSVLEFQSSGTTGMERSRHSVVDISIYERSSITAFESLIQPLDDLCILALLPNYLEQENSSLIHMVRLFMDHSENEQNGFFLDQFEELAQRLEMLESVGHDTLLIGVPYALLDFFEDRKFDLRHIVLMETGGMKGRRKEMVRSELHRILKDKTGLDKVHSEYGMTELLSQAYSLGEGVFQCPGWMKVSIREVNDPLSKAKPGKTGGINIMDLANAHSCAFIATMDLGRMVDETRFEVLGRFDNSDVRGCNLMVQQ